MQISNQWNFKDIKNMDNFVRAVLAVLNGNIDNENIAAGYKLLTDAEYTQLSSGIDSVSYVDKSGGTLVKGMPIYFSAAGGVMLADASDTSKEARGFCISTDGSNAQVRASGAIADVPIESGITITFGQTIWLSTTAGYVTNVMPGGGNLEQELGVSTAAGTRAGGTVDINAIIRAPLEELL